MGREGGRAFRFGMGNWIVVCTSADFKADARRKLAVCCPALA